MSKGRPKSAARTRARSRKVERGTGTQAAANEPFLARWSRRKSQARAQVQGEPPAVAAPPPKPAKVLTDADMPPVESLNEKSDFSIFMSPGVSEGLRKRALRKLFLLPEFSQRDPLDGEYYDFGGLEPLGDVVTHEMREEMEREARKLAEAAKQAPPEQTTAEKPASKPADETMPLGPKLRKKRSAA